MKKLMLILVAALFASCATQKKKEDNAYRFLRENPDKAAAYCATAFPVKETVGEPIITPGNNKDYTGQISQLNGLVDELRNRTIQDSIKIAAGGVIEAQELTKYKNDIIALKKQISALKAEYKECEPTTIKIPIYQENTARVKELEANVDALNKTIAGHEERIKIMTADNKALQKYKWGFFGLLIGMAGFIVFKILKP